MGSKFPDHGYPLSEQDLESGHHIPYGVDIVAKTLWQSQRYIQKLQGQAMVPVLWANHGQEQFLIPDRGLAEFCTCWGADRKPWSGCGWSRPLAA